MAVLSFSISQGSNAELGRKAIAIESQKPHWKLPAEGQGGGKHGV